MSKMPKKIWVDGVDVVPIPIREDTQPDLFNLLKNPAELKYRVIRSMEEVLSIMLENGLTLIDNRRAVWFYLKFYGINDPPIFLHEMIGESFPDTEFDEGCYRFSKEKVDRTVECDLLCSYENRNLKEKKFGGSARLVFELIPKSGPSRFITLVGAPSGFKEWEDMGVFLGSLYNLGLIKLEDWLIQEILKRADKAVAGQPDFLPPNMTIAQYTENLFTVIDADRATRVRSTKHF